MVLCMHSHAPGDALLIQKAEQGAAMMKKYGVMHMHAVTHMNIFWLCKGVQ